MRIIELNILAIRRAVMLTAVGAAILLACLVPGCKEDQGTSSRSSSQVASQPGGDAAGRRGEGDGRDELARRQAQREQDLAAIASAKSAADLKGFLAGDRPILKAAIQRLAQLGDADSVRLLGETMESAPRSAGAGADGSAMAMAMHALADVAPRSPAAVATIDKTVDRLLQAGPDGDVYTHIYDPQYYEVLQEGLRGLGGTDAPAVGDKLQRLAADDKQFYSIREAAQRAMLQREMRQKKAATPADRVALLLGRVEPAGALLENTWSGKSPGDKLPAAVRQGAVETLILNEGWAAAEHVSRKLAASTNDTERLAMGKLLSIILIQRLSTRPPGQGPDVAEEARTLRTLLDELSKATGAALESPTLAGVVDRLQVAADALADDDLNARGAALWAKVKRPGAWAGPAPTAAQLGVAPPADAVFIPELSTRVTTPAGPLLRACFVTAQSPAEVVAHFEGRTGRKAVVLPEPNSSPQSQQTGEPAERARYQIRLDTPAAVAPFLTCGVIIHASPDPYEFRVFGKVLHRGRTLFQVIVCHHG